MRQLSSLAGQKIGKLTVLGIDEENKYASDGQVQWKCLCECGAVCYKTTNSLKRPSKTAPKACSKKCGASLPIGYQSYYLTVIKPLFYDGKPTRYLCACQCGNIVEIEQSSLKNATTKSCGCYQKQRMAEIAKANYSDIAGQRFGHLVALEPTELRQIRSIVWKCQCDCGNIHLASVSNLKNGYVDRCKICHVGSRGEEKIKYLLNDAGLNFTTEKTFDTCRFLDTSACAKFDFFIENKYIVEFDGMQHFIPSSWDETNPTQKLDYIQAHDAYKNQWCKENNIPLIRIPYTILDSLSIEDLRLETSKYIQN